jgi:hypothetical protein
MRPLLKEKDMPVVHTEKCCSHCGIINWDSQTGGYSEDCTAAGREGQKCDTNGEVRKFDENGNRVY